MELKKIIVNFALQLAQIVRYQIVLLLGIWKALWIHILIWCYGCVCSFYYLFFRIFPYFSLFVNDLAHSIFDRPFLLILLSPSRFYRVYHVITSFIYYKILPIYPDISRNLPECSINLEQLFFTLIFIFHFSFFGIKNRVYACLVLKNNLKIMTIVLSPP